MIDKKEIRIQKDVDVALRTNTNFKGFVKIHKIHKKTGKKELVVAKDNLILIMGAQLLAALLGGQPNSAISYYYVGFNNLESFTYPTIDIQYSAPFNSLSIPGGFGYLRLPLSFSPNYLSDAGYENNTVVFTTMINSDSAFYGNTFISGVSNIYECGLVASPLGTPESDIVFSRVNFQQLTYDNSFALAISWGIKFLASSS